MRLKPASASVILRARSMRLRAETLDRGILSDRAVIGSLLRAGGYAAVVLDTFAYAATYRVPVRARSCSMLFMRRSTISSSIRSTPSRSPRISPYSGHFRLRVERGRSGE